MAITDGSYRPRVATLTFQSTPPSPIDPPVHSIFPHDTLSIGRNEVERLFGFRDQTISTHHLIFRCLVYEDEAETTVSPMVYVRVQSSQPVHIVRSSSKSASRAFVARKGDQDVLLNHGDILSLTATLSVLFQHDLAYNVGENDFNAAEWAELQQFSTQHVVSNRVLGWGGQATVYLATERYTGRQVACKMVRLPQPVLDEDPRVMRQDRKEDCLSAQRHRRREVERLRRAVNILKFTNHPNIINLEKAVFAHDTIYIFEELITGGDLHSFFQRRGKLAEPNVAVIIRQLLKAVEYLHDNDIVHRDIKPENILMTSWHDGARIVLTDFGQSRNVNETGQFGRKCGQGRMHTAVGTEGYAAPEVVAQKNEGVESIGYSKAVDLWSIGCITALLLTGVPLFPLDDEPISDDYSATQQLKQRVGAMFDRPEWTGIGRNAKAFIKGCVTIEESQRLTAKQALMHIWFTNKHYALAMEAAYHRAIQDSKRRPKRHPVIMNINTSGPAAASTSAAYIDRMAQNVTSKFFTSALHANPFVSPLHRSSATGASPGRRPLLLPSISQDVEMDQATCGPPPTSSQIQSWSAHPTQPVVRSQRSPATQAVDIDGGLSIAAFSASESQLIAVPESPTLPSAC